MKLLLLITSIVLSTTAFGDDFYKKKYANYQVDNSHRVMMQNDINKAVNKQNELDKRIIDSKKDFLNAKTPQDMCRDVALLDSDVNLGGFEPTYFQRSYRNCLQQIGLLK